MLLSREKACGRRRIRGRRNGRSRVSGSFFRPCGIKTCLVVEEKAAPDKIRKNRTVPMWADG